MGLGRLQGEKLGEKKIRWEKFWAGYSWDSKEKLVRG